MKQYDSANLIDDVSVHNWVVDALKRFGNLPTIQIEKVSHDALQHALLTALAQGPPNLCPILLQNYYSSIFTFSK